MNALTEFSQDIYDVLGMNTNHCTQEDFYYRWVETDHAFMVDNDDPDKAYIYFDDFKITIENA